MAILIQCPDCRGKYKFENIHGGEGFACKCGKKIKIPSAAKDGSDIKQCFFCRNVGSAEMVICIECGYNFNTGIKLKTSTGEDTVEEKPGIISRRLYRIIRMFHWVICFLHYGVAAALFLVIIVFGCKLVPHFWDDMCYVCKDKLATRSEYKEYQYMSKSARRPYYSSNSNVTVTYRLCKGCKAPGVIENASLFDCWGIKVGRRASTIPICLAGIFLAIPTVISFVMAQRSRRLLACGENPSWSKLYNIRQRKRISK